GRSVGTPPWARPAAPPRARATRCRRGCDDAPPRDERGARRGDPALSVLGLRGGRRVQRGALRAPLVREATRRARSGYVLIRSEPEVSTDGRRTQHRDARDLVVLGAGLRGPRPQR